MGPGGPKMTQGNDSCKPLGRPVDRCGISVSQMTTDTFHLS